MYKLVINMDPFFNGSNFNENWRPDGNQNRHQKRTRAHAKTSVKKCPKNVMQVVQEAWRSPLCHPKGIKEPWNMVQRIRDTPLVPVGTV